MSRPLLAIARGAAFRAAALRGRAMVLVYHRLSPDGGRPHEIVPNLPVRLFGEQIEALGNTVDIVPLKTLLDQPYSRVRVRVAITFDDDEPSHVTHALPTLGPLGVPATFFLSGRSLHGLGPYWWMLLERLIEVKGVARAAAALGLEARNPGDLAAQCEGRAAADRLPSLIDAPDGLVLRPAQFARFSRPGAGVGFHTLHHPVLTSLGDSELADEAGNGLSALGEATRSRITLFAYPHGRADRRVAQQVRAAGFRAAFRTGRRPVAPGSDPCSLGRWEAGPLGVDDLLTQLALRLHYPTGELPG